MSYVSVKHCLLFRLDKPFFANNQLEIYSRVIHNNILRANIGEKTLYNEHSTMRPVEECRKRKNCLQENANCKRFDNAVRFFSIPQVYRCLERCMQMLHLRIFHLCRIIQLKVTAHCQFETHSNLDT